MKTQNRLLLILVLLLSIKNFSQENPINEKTENDYKNYSYVKTTEILLKVAEKGYESPELFMKLGNSYYFNSNYKEASKWYGKLVQLDEKIDPEYYFRYSLSLKATESYEEADKWMQKFIENKPADSRSKTFLHEKDYLDKIRQIDNKHIELSNANFNSPLSDFGVALLEESLVFASTRGGGKVHEWNEEPYLDLYKVEKGTSNLFENVSSFSDKINSVYHESSVCFSPDQKTIYFTRNNFLNKRVRIDKKGINRLQIFKARLNERNEWEKVTPVHFNSLNYSIAHPSINKEGTKIYFSSDMDGSYGMSDLYVADVFTDGTLGDPENLGVKINTEGQENYPFVNVKGDLFFASNGYPGLGGLDVFVIRGFEKKINNDQEITVENLGQPINSPMDDFAYFENAMGAEGYVSSNRIGGKGGDDIYNFKISECKNIIRGKIKEQNSGIILLEATVFLFDEKGNKLKEVKVDENGIYSFEVSCDEEYIVRGVRVGYVASEERFTAPSTFDDVITKDISLRKEELPMKPCADLAQLLGIPIIYFDYDKYDIRDDAEIELQKILVVLKEHTNMILEIRSHTDCRGSKQYNKQLSENRAKSTKSYFVANGVSSDRLTTIGFGEERLLNDCACSGRQSHNCNEEELLKNCRSEFIIKSIDGKVCETP